MKCKNCGGEVRLEEMYCPYCGSPNMEAQKHARDMQKYQYEFQQTKEDVMDMAGRHSRKSVRLIVILVLLLAIAFNIFLQFNSYGIGHMLRRFTSGMSEDKYRQKVEAYLSAEDYMGLSAFCNNYDLYEYRDLYDEYSPIVTISREYRYSCQQIMRLVNLSEYSDPETVIRYTSEYVQRYYESLDMEKYSYYESFDSEEARRHIENMNESLEAIYVAYLSMTPEEAKNMSTMPRAERVIHLEKGLAQYAEVEKNE